VSERAHGEGNGKDVLLKVRETEREQLVQLGCRWLKSFLLAIAEKEVAGER